MSIPSRIFTVFRRSYSSTVTLTWKSYKNVVVRPDFGGLRLKVEFERKDSTESKSVSSAWLVHNCGCPRCRQEFTGQKLVEPSRLKPFYTLKDIRLDENNLYLSWYERDTHESLIPVSELFIHLLQPTPPSEKDSSSAEGPRRFISSTVPVPELDHSAAMELDGFKMSKLLNDYGVCLITGAPLELDSVTRLAINCGSVQRTVYGSVFDVMTVEDATNIAYTDAPLHPHMDLVYYESPPGIQFLHCLEFDPPDLVQGGESIVVDAWKTALLFKERFPEHFVTLAGIPASFQKIHTRGEEPVYMKYKRPHIVLDGEGRVVAVNWSPAFEAPLEAADPETAETYYRGYTEFARLLQESPFRGGFRLRPGDVLCFNNRRMLHGREAVTRKGRGRRHLRGCYVNIDEFKSRLLLSALKHESDYNVGHVLNGSHY